MFPFTNRHRVIDSESTLLADSEKSLLPKKEIRFKDEIPAVSKEDEYVSVLGDEPAKSEQCYFCHGREDLVSCTGGCNRAYHLRCIGMKATTNYANWKCKQCRGMALKSSDYHKKHCLKQWYLKYVVSLQSGEKSIVFEGIRCFDNTVWKCSPVSSVIDPTHFQTVNNAIYILIGEEDAKKSAANGFQQDVCDAFQKGIPQDWKARIGGCGAESELAQQPSDVSIDKEREKGVMVDNKKEKGVVVEEEVREEEQEKVNEEKTKVEGDKEAPSAPQPAKAPAKRRRRNATVPSVRVIPLDPEDSDPSAAEPQEPLEPSEFPPPVRRSSRIRMPPLAFWKNEYLRENVKTGRTELIVGSSNADLPSVMAHAFPLEPSPSVYEMVTAAAPSVRRSKEKKSGEKKEKRVEKTVKKKPERPERPERPEKEKEKVEKKKQEKRVEKETKNPVKKPKTKTPPVEKPKAPEPVFVEVRFRSDSDR